MSGRPLSAFAHHGRSLALGWPAYVVVVTVGSWCVGPPPPRVTTLVGAIVIVLFIVGMVQGAAHHIRRDECSRCRAPDRPEEVGETMARRHLEALRLFHWKAESWLAKAVLGVAIALIVAQFFEFVPLWLGLGVTVALVVSVKVDDHVEMWHFRLRRWCPWCPRAEVPDREGSHV